MREGGWRARGYWQASQLSGFSSEQATASSAVNAGFGAVAWTLPTVVLAILVAGRGHEVYQEVKGVNVALDDRVELRSALAHFGFPAAAASRIES